MKTHTYMHMVIDMESAYRQKRTKGEQRIRVVIEMPKEEVEAIDSWGVPAGMPSRNAAVRHLIQEGLKAAAHKENSDA